MHLRVWDGIQTNTMNCLAYMQACLHLLLYVYLNGFSISTVSVPPTAPSSTPVPQPSDATAPSQIGLSNYYTAVGMAGLFAFLFLLAALIVLVLVCAVVAVSRRHSKSITSHATELEPSQQSESLHEGDQHAASCSVLFDIDIATDCILWCELLVVNYLEVHDL